MFFAILKKGLSFFFYIFGGIYLLKNKTKNTAILVVFNYHSFSKYNNYIFKRGFITETGYQKRFEKQLKFIRKHYNICNPRDFYNSKQQNGISIFLTFDDGYKDNYDIAYPLLKKYSIPAAFFIVTSLPDTNDWLFHDKLRFLVQNGKIIQDEAEEVLTKLNQGEDIKQEFVQKVEDEWKNFEMPRLMMNWKEIKEIDNSGFIVGSHTHMHKPLLFLDSSQREEELKRSIEILSHKLNKEITHFAYPNGLYDNDCFKMFNNSSLQFVYTTKPGINKQTDSPYEIKRIGINASDSIGIILMKMYLSIRK